jgi:hypothetical protein
MENIATPEHGPNCHHHKTDDSHLRTSKQNQVDRPPVTMYPDNRERTLYKLPALKARRKQRAQYWKSTPYLAQFSYSQRIFH